MRNYIVPVLIFLLVFIASLLIVRFNNAPEVEIEPSPSPTMTATPSATLAPSPKVIYQTVPAPQPTPIIIHEKEVQKETVREVPATPAPQPTHPADPSPTPRGRCVLGVCVDLP